MRIPFGMIVLVGAVAVAGCSQKGLRDIRKTGTGPDEFLVLPNKPLNEPADYSSLPEPTPGAGNIADPTPQADAVAAQGRERALGHLGEVLALELHRARGGRVERADEVQRGRLSGARRPNHHHNLAASDVQIDVVEDVQIPKMLVDVL